MLDLVHFTDNPSRLYIQSNYIKIVTSLEPSNIFGRTVRKTADSEGRTFLLGNS